MPYILENMVPEDIPQVAKVERLCFTLPWPTSAYRRELKTPETNRYIVQRYFTPAEAARIHLPEPTEANLTSLYHPELASTNGVEPHDKAEPSLLSRWATLLPWLRTGSENGTDKSAHD